MHFYIDGYNLLFRLLHPGEELQKVRDQIKEDLAKKINLLEMDATLVFDSHYQEEGLSSVHIQRLKVVYTAKGETADEFILHEIKDSKSPQNITVITSDKKLAWLCRRRLANTESVENFIVLLNKRYKNKVKPKIQPTPPKLPPKPAKKVEPPTSSDKAENMFDYYLNTFETEFKQIVPTPKPIQNKPKKKPKVPQAPTKEDATLSDMERWLAAFEKPN